MPSETIYFKDEELHDKAENRIKQGEFRNWSHLGERAVRLLLGQNVIGIDPDLWYDFSRKVKKGGDDPHELIIDFIEEKCKEMKYR